MSKELWGKIRELDDKTRALEKRITELEALLPEYPPRKPGSPSGNWFNSYKQVLGEKCLTT